MKLLLFSDCCCLIGMGHAPAGHRPLLLWFFLCWFSCVVASIFPPLFLSFFPKIGKKLSMQMCFHHFSIEKFSPNHWSDVGGCFLFISFFPPFLYIIRLLFYFHYYYYLLLAGRTGFLFSIHWFPPPPTPSTAPIQLLPSGFILLNDFNRRCFAFVSDWPSRPVTSPAPAVLSSGSARHPPDSPTLRRGGESGATVAVSSGRIRHQPMGK